MNIKYLLATAGALEGFLFGSGADIKKGITWLIILMAFHIITTMCIKENKSDTVRTTVIRCVLDLLFISFSHFVEIYMGVQIEIIVISAFCMSEGYSVLENFTTLGLPLPAQIKNIFGSGTDGK